LTWIKRANLDGSADDFLAFSALCMHLDCIVDVHRDRRLRRCYRSSTGAEGAPRVMR
jgi:Rieske Fe-S protein